MTIDECGGVATGVISVFIPPKSAQVNFLWGKNDIRTAIQQFYTPKKLLYPPKQISGYTPGRMHEKTRILCISTVKSIVQGQQEKGVSVCDIRLIRHVC